MSRKSVVYKANLRPEDFGSVTNTTDDTETTRIGNSSRELRAGSNVHT